MRIPFQNFPLRMYQADLQGVLSCRSLFATLKEDKKCSFSSDEGISPKNELSEKLSFSKLIRWDTVSGMLPVKLLWLRSSTCNSPILTGMVPVRLSPFRYIASGNLESWLCRHKCLLMGWTRSTGNSLGARTSRLAISSDASLDNLATDLGRGPERKFRNLSKIGLAKSLSNWALDL